MPRAQPSEISNYHQQTLPLYKSLTMQTFLELWEVSQLYGVAFTVTQVNVNVNTS